MVKSAMNIASTRHFAMVYVMKNSLKLEFALARDLGDECIIRTQEVGKDKYSNRVKLTHEADIDGKLLIWLREAYSLAR